MAGGTQQQPINIVCEGHTETQCPARHWLRVNKKPHSCFKFRENPGKRDKAIPTLACGSCCNFCGNARAQRRVDGGVEGEVVVG